MATKPTKTSTVKAKQPSGSTTAPKVSRARKSEPMMVAPPHEAIALRAYELFIARGHQHGLDVEDWLTAEHELRISK
jgi:hypothetical protein